MSAPQAPSLPPPQAIQTEKYEYLKYTLSAGLLVACPVIMLLPPRKLDLYTFTLGGMFLASANQLTYAHSGRSILQRINGLGERIDAAALPTEKARQLQQRIREEREAEMRRLGKEREQGVMEKLWMGGEKEGWRERRLKEEREAIEQGKGYGDLISEQIWEVWNWGKPREGKDGQGISGAEKEKIIEKEHPKR